MSPRRARRRPPPARRPGAAELQRSVDGPAGPDGPTWLVRPVPGARATKTYRCPGCDHEVRPGVSHVVAWPEHRADDRRHWHTACWERRRRLPPP